jgi:hypothetical protein
MLRAQANTTMNQYTNRAEMLSEFSCVLQHCYLANSEKSIVPLTSSLDYNPFGKSDVSKIGNKRTDTKIIK